MFTIDWTRAGMRGRRLLAVAPAMLVATGVAMAASSTPRPDLDRTAVTVAGVAGGDLLAAGLSSGWDGLALSPSLAGGSAPEAGVAADEGSANGALRPARPFVFDPASEVDRGRAVRCLTQAVYYEAALESDAGQAAVAQVVLNRVRDPNYPGSVCGVVFEGAERTTGCQFSFTCDGSLAQAPVAWAWDRARAVAERALKGHVATEVGTATHYHADYVSPWWAPTLTRITQIGTHIFYRWKGIYGETAALRDRYARREPVIDEARFSRPRLMLASTGAGEVAPEADLQAGTGLRTVEIDGQTRVVGAASLGGRRAATSEEITAINARLQAFEAGSAAPAALAPAAAAPPPAPGVTAMEVEEVGLPTG